MSLAGDRIREFRTIQSASEADQHFNRIYIATLALEQLQRDGKLSAQDVSDLEFRRDRLSKLFDRARGVS
jgi:hypothetical protein